MFAPINMKLAILANEDQKKEWLAKPTKSDAQLIWVANIRELAEAKANACFDLLFQNDSSHLDSLSQVNGPLFVNEVIYPFDSLLKKFSPKERTSFFRLNAWPGFLKRELVELCAFKKEEGVLAEQILSSLGWKAKLVPDVPGLISARIVAMIINEAYYTLQAEVSTKQEIDIAMKLGTNYPHGPFEWCEMIGLHNVYRLLLEMSKEDEKYQPAELMIKETEAQAAWH
jgi:3-hydroxybutyryl-CoA dehydrogenase